MHKYLQWIDAPHPIAQIRAHFKCPQLVAAPPSRYCFVSSPLPRGGVMHRRPHASAAVMPASLQLSPGWLPGQGCWCRCAALAHSTSSVQSRPPVVPCAAIAPVAPGGSLPLHNSGKLPPGVIVALDHHRRLLEYPIQAVPSDNSWRSPAARGFPAGSSGKTKKVASTRLAEVASMPRGAAWVA